MRAGRHGRGVSVRTCILGCGGQVWVNQRGANLSLFPAPHLINEISLYFYIINTQMRAPRHSLSVCLVSESVVRVCQTLKIVSIDLRHRGTGGGL